MKGCALELVLKQRPKANRYWPIAVLAYCGGFPLHFYMGVLPPGKFWWFRLSTKVVVVFFFSFFE